MNQTLYALMLIFTPPNADPIGVPLDRNLDFVACQIERTEYLELDPNTPGIVLCLEQDALSLPPLKETTNG